MSFDPTPNNTGLYPFANSNELNVLDPEKTLDGKVALDNNIASDERVVSICSRSNIDFTVGCFLLLYPSYYAFWLDDHWAPCNGPLGISS